MSKNIYGKSSRYAITIKSKRVTPFGEVQHTLSDTFTS